MSRYVVAPARLLECVREGRPSAQVVRAGPLARAVGDLLAPVMAKNVSATQAGALAPRLVYFFHTEQARQEGTACHRHRVFGAAHEPIAEGFLYRTFRPSPVSFSGEPEGPAIFLQLRTSFPLTGKIDIRDASTRALLGVATRSYRLYGADERPLARFEDAVPLKARAQRALGELALDIVLGTDGSAGGAAPSEFVLRSEGARLGSLRRRALPFFPDPPRRSELGRARATLKVLLPARVGRLLFERAPPYGWELELEEQAVTLDERLLLCFGMSSIEMRNWSSF